MPEHPERDEGRPRTELTEREMRGREAGPERGAKGPLLFALRTAIYRSLKTWDELRQASERDRLLLPEHPERDGGRPPTAELTEREARRTVLSSVLGVVVSVLLCPPSLCNT